MRRAIKNNKSRMTVIGLGLLGLVCLWANGAYAQNAYYLPQIANGAYGAGYFKTTFVFCNNSGAADQAAAFSSLVDTQRANLYASPTANIVSIRTKISALLRSLLTNNGATDDIKAQVLALSGTYGDLDGENNYHHATVIAQVYKGLTSGQKANLAALRKSIMSGTYSNGTPFDFSVCTTPFLYSSVITDASITSYINNTEYLFYEP
jgi:hypothetical protein